MTDQIPESHPRLFRVVTAAWLALVSALVLVDHVRFSRWIEAHPAGTQRAKVARLDSNFAQLEAAIAAMRGEPAPVSAANYVAAERAQNARLDRIEESLSGVVVPTDLVPLTQRVTRLEAAVWRLRHPRPLRPVAIAPNGSRRPLPPRAADVAPPFTVLGTELRGGEPFLTVVPFGAHGLSQVLVLRPGEAAGDWRLEALEGRTAVFDVAGRLMRLPIP